MELARARHARQQRQRAAGCSKSRARHCGEIGTATPPVRGAGREAAIAVVVVLVLALRVAHETLRKRPRLAGPVVAASGDRNDLCSVGWRDGGPAEAVSPRLLNAVECRLSIVDQWA